MKIGVLFSGFLRTYFRFHETFNQQIFSKHDCDIKYCFWNRLEGPPNNNLRVPSQNNFGEYVSLKDINLLNKFGEVLPVNIDRYTSTKKCFKIIDRENDVFKTDERAKQHGEYFVNRIIDQWYLIKQGYLMFKDTSQYDIIMRLRFDGPVHNIEVLYNDMLNVPKDIGGWQFTDHMAYGKPDIMKTYCLLYDEIENLYIQHNIDVSHAVNMPLFYIKNKNIKINTDTNIKYSIVKR